MKPSWKIHERISRHCIKKKLTKTSSNSNTKEQLIELLEEVSLIITTSLTQSMHWNLWIRILMDKDEWTLMMFTWCNLKQRKADNREWQNMPRDWYSVSGSISSILWKLLVCIVTTTHSSQGSAASYTCFVQYIRPSKYGRARGPPSAQSKGTVCTVYDWGSTARARSRYTIAISTNITTVTTTCTRTDHFENGITGVTMLTIFSMVTATVGAIKLVISQCVEKEISTDA